MKRHNSKKPRLCIVIPAYNEASVIKDVISNADKVLSKSLPSYKYEIVVINDASTDHTKQQAELAGATVITHILNSGAGGATATGLRYAEQNHFDYAATMDADGQHAIEDVIACIEYLAKTNSDLTIGSRLIDSEGMSKTKVIGNKGLSLITRILFGINSTDSQSGLRVFSRRALEQLRWKTSGYEFCSEMLWRAKQKNMTITEYPIQAIYTEYSKSKGQDNWNAINIIKSLVKRRIVEFLG